MDVVESNNITNTISYLRTNIYNTANFRGEFIANLNKYINATSIKYSPDQYGGWSINIICDISKFNNFSNSSEFFLNKVFTALHTTLIEIGCNNITITPNIINVTVIGLDNIIVKI